MAAARSEVEELDRRRTALLTEMESMRDRLQAVLSGASEPWRPPTSETASLAPTDAASVPQDVDLTETQVIDLDQNASTTAG